MIHEVSDVEVESVRMGKVVYMYTLKVVRLNFVAGSLSLISMPGVSSETHTPSVTMHRKLPGNSLSLLYTHTYYSTQSSLSPCLLLFHVSFSCFSRTHTYTQPHTHTFLHTHTRGLLMSSDPICLTCSWCSLGSDDIHLILTRLFIPS